MVNNTTHDNPQSAQRRKRRRRATLAYHRIKCTICRHPRCETIEHDYLHWHSPARIAREYSALNPSAIYRHAQATGLDAKRRRNAISSLEFIIEHAASIVPTAKDVIHAVRACCRLNQEGQWIDPPNRREVIQVDEHGNPLPTDAKETANPEAQPKTSHVTNVTSRKNPENQSPTLPIRNWFISLKTKATRLIQSQTFSHFPKSQKSASAPPQTASVSRSKTACLSASVPPNPSQSAILPLNKFLGVPIAGSLRASVSPWQNSSNPPSVDVYVAHLLL
ncbi:MAG: hypothetical protein WAL95_13210 [Candidatus Acidiferrales bacterium]